MPPAPKSESSKDQLQKKRTELIKVRLFINRQVLKQAKETNAFLALFSFDEVEEAMNFTDLRVAYKILIKKEKELAEIMRGNYFLLRQKVMQENKIPAYCLYDDLFKY